MRAAVRHIFKKNGLILLLVFLLFALMKGRSAAAAEELRSEDSSQLRGWLEEVRELDETEREAFMQALRLSIYTGEEPSPKAIQNYSRLHASFSNARTVESLIRFARDKEGQLPVVLPPRYTELMPFYAELPQPAMVDEEPLTIYWALQKESMIPILILFLISIFGGGYYEAQMHQYTAVTPRGRTFRRAFWGLLLSLCYAMLLLNELFDLLYSGLLFAPRLWEASLQSVSAFAYSQVNLTVGGALGLIALAKIAGTFLLYRLARFFAARSGGVKEALAASVFLLLLLLLSSQALENTILYPMLQVGCVDWQKLLQSTERLPGWPVSFFPLGTAVLVLTQGLWFLSLGRQGKISKK